MQFSGQTQVEQHYQFDGLFLFCCQEKQSRQENSLIAPLHDELSVGVALDGDSDLFLV
ncbi:hypothetical protein D3C75_1247550 [compost metagenome]